MSINLRNIIPDRLEQLDAEVLLNFSTPGKLSSELSSVTMWSSDVDSSDDGDVEMQRDRGRLTFGSGVDVATSGSCWVPRKDVSLSSLILRFDVYTLYVCWYSSHLWFSTTLALRSMFRDVAEALTGKCSGGDDVSLAGSAWLLMARLSIEKLWRFTGRDVGTNIMSVNVTRIVTNTQLFPMQPTSYTHLVQVYSKNHITHW